VKRAQPFDSFEAAKPVEHALAPGYQAAHHALPPQRVRCCRAAQEARRIQEKIDRLVHLAGGRYTCGSSRAYAGPRARLAAWREL
jgi:hypothetical protein